PLPDSHPTTATSQPMDIYTGPFPIICATINLSFGEDLAWQERKAASFAFTPLYSGYHVGWTTGKHKHHVSFNGFVPTFHYAVPEGGINIATAVAISGAAASPN
ncbi:MAG: acyltransferase, partial [Acidobacteria bacterium]